MWTRLYIFKWCVHAELRNDKLYAKKLKIKQQLTTYSRNILQVISAHTSSKLPQRGKAKIIPQILPIRGSTDNLYDHIEFTVRSHISYLLFDYILNSNHYQNDSSDDEEIPGTKK